MPKRARSGSEELRQIFKIYEKIVKYFREKQKKKELADKSLIRTLNELTGMIEMARSGQLSKQPVFDKIKIISRYIVDFLTACSTGAFTDAAVYLIPITPYERGFLKNMATKYQRIDMQDIDGGANPFDNIEDDDYTYLPRPKRPRVSADSDSDGDDPELLPWAPSRRQSTPLRDQPPRTRFYNLHKQIYKSLSKAYKVIDRMLKRKQSSRIKQMNSFIDLDLLRYNIKDVMDKMHHPMFSEMDAEWLISVLENISSLDAFMKRSLYPPPSRDEIITPNDGNDDVPGMPNEVIGEYIDQVKDFIKQHAYDLDRPDLMEIYRG